MSVAIEEAVRIIELIAPASLACGWDNTGLLLRCSDTVSGVMIALDVTDAVVDEAAGQGCDMIISHHPLIFDPMRSLRNDQPIGSVVMRLIRKGISVYAAHTSYDIASGGINDILAGKLGLKDVFTADDEGEGLMRVGMLPKTMSANELAAYVKKCIGIKHLMISDCSCDNIDKVAVVGGSGGGMVAEAVKKGANALITGEARHSNYIEAQANGMLLIEAGHFDTERFFVEEVFLSLQSRLDEVQLHLGLKKATCESAPYKVV